MLVVAISIVSIGPAMWSQNADLVREQTIQLMLAGVAAGLACSSATTSERQRCSPRAR